MARKPRVHYKGALYHVMVRGNNKEKELQNEIYKRKYLEAILSYKNRLGFKLYAYCIMDNHAHPYRSRRSTTCHDLIQNLRKAYNENRLKQDLSITVNIKF